MPQNFCKKAYRSMEIHSRLHTLRNEMAAHTKEYEAAAEKHTLQTQAFELEQAQLIEEMNALFGITSSKRVEKSVATVRHTTHRNWTEKEQQSFKDRAMRLLLDSPGLTANAIAKKLGTGKSGSARMLGEMTTDKLLRLVPVTIAAGKKGTAVRKGQGYALPLRAVEKAS